MKALLPWIRQGGIPSLSRDHNTLLTTAMPDSSQQICHKHNLILQPAFIVPWPFIQKEAFYSIYRIFIEFSFIILWKINKPYSQWDQEYVHEIKNLREKKRIEIKKLQSIKHMNEMYINIFYPIEHEERGLQRKNNTYFQLSGSRSGMWLTWDPDASLVKAAPCNKIQADSYSLGTQREQISWKVSLRL